MSPIIKLPQAIIEKELEMQNREITVKEQR